MNISTLPVGYERTMNPATVAKVWCPVRKAPLTIKKLRITERASLEIEVLKSLNHPSIPGFISGFAKGDTSYIAMEFRKGQTLSQAMTTRDFTEADIRYIMKQLVNVVAYLHSTKKVVHRNLKSENVILDEYNNVSLIDFGFADFITDNMTERLGTPAYCAPELVRGIPYSEAIDVWSLGVIAYLLMMERLPFQGNTIEDVFKSICYDEPKFFSGSGKPPSTNFIHFVRETLSKDPEKRPKITDLLTHPWVCASSDLKKAVKASTCASAASIRSTLPRRAVLKPRVCASLLTTV